MSRPWRVHELTKDFELEDVWELPTPGRPDDLTRLVQQFTSPGGDDEFPTVFRALFALRWKLGKLFGWDKPGSGVGERVRSLRERLPADLLEAPRGPDLRAVPGRTAVDGPPIFSSVYQTHDEWLVELSNKTVHSLMHIGWVPDVSGSGYHAQMAVLVKPNGRFGRAYMAAIKPFRYALVYPMLLRSIGHQWKAQAGGCQIVRTPAAPVWARRFGAGRSRRLRRDSSGRGRALRVATATSGSGRGVTLRRRRRGESREAPSAGGGGAEGAAGSCSPPARWRCSPWRWSRSTAGRGRRPTSRRLPGR